MTHALITAANATSLLADERALRRAVWSGVIRPVGAEVETLQESLQRHYDGCLMWKGKVHPSGYPRLQVSVAPDYRRLDIAVHRLVFVLANGRIEPGARVARTCRQRLCIAPGHLRAVTQAEIARRLFDDGRLRRFDGGESGHGRRRGVENGTRERGAW